MSSVQHVKSPFEQLCENLNSVEFKIDWDIAEYNLLCTSKLPGSQALNIDEALSRIDEMAYRVDAEIRRNYHRFRANPSEADHSQAKYCVLMMVTVLQQDFGVSYNPERIRNPDFRNSGDLFIHGMLGGAGGTCASMPVLYTAVARRLGWPMKLVHTQAHLFCRWDDPDGKHPFGKERFNLEATGQGANFFPDEYYETWPIPISHDLVERFGYLKSLTPAEEIADFLVMRGHCLEDNGRLAEACDAYRLACRLAPKDVINPAFFENANRMRQRMIERRILLDYFGPDVPLPFGYFPHHVLQMMAAEMGRTKLEYDNRMNQAHHERFHPMTPRTLGRPPVKHFPVPQTLHNPPIPVGFGLPPGLVGIIPGIPSPITNPGFMFTGDGQTFPAELLQVLDPHRLAARRQQAIAIRESMPKGRIIQQPNRIHLLPPNAPHLQKSEN